MAGSAFIINLLVTIVIAVLILYLIQNYLLPLLPPPFGQILQIVIVIVAIIWLINLITPGLGLYHTASLTLDKIGLLT